jgi:hypothetical protein
MVSCVGQIALKKDTVGSLIDGLNAVPPVRLGYTQRQGWLLYKICYAVGVREVIITL